jgi:magnesium transporter
MITHYFRTLKDERLKLITDVRSGVWTHVVAAGESDFDAVIKLFDLDSTIVADAQDLFEVPRFDRSAGILYFFTRYPFDHSDEDIDTAPILIVMGESFVLTMAQQTVPFIDQMVKKEDVYTTQKAKLFIQIMSSLTTAFDNELVHMRKAVYKDRVRLQRIQTGDIARLVGYEHALNEAIAALIPTNAWLNQLMTGNHMQLFSEDIDLMEDLMIANSQLVESSKMLLKTIQNIRSATEAIVTQNLNNTIRMLTALTITLTVPTIIASLYGMNVRLPFADNQYVFFGILAAVLVVIAGMMLYFKLKKWF